MEATATSPGSVEREAIVAALIYDECAAAFAKLMRAEYFSEPRYAAMAGEILDQLNSGDGFDPATAARNLKSHPAFPGGNDDVVCLIQELSNEYASRAQFPHKCAQIVEASRKRDQLIDIHRLQTEARNGSTSTEICRATLETVARWKEQAAGFGRRDRFSFKEFRRAYPSLRPPIIDGIAREGQTVNIISGTKVGKSWFIYLLALCVVMGRDFLGRFATRAGRVLLIDFELQREDLSYRIHESAQAMGLYPEDYEELLEIWALRGKSTTLSEIADELLRHEPGEFNLVIWDAKYRVNRPGAEENSNDDETDFYAIVDEIGEHTRAVQALVHHASKGDQSGKRTTDVGSGGGAQSRAVDTHLVLREHEDPDCVVLDAAVRSFAPIQPLVLKWCFPIWSADTSADPSRLKRQPTGQQQRQQSADREGMEAIIKALRGNPGTERDLRKRAGMGKERLERLLSMMIRDGHLTTKPITIRGNETDEYHLAE